MALSKITSAAIQDASIAAADLASGAARANFGAGAVVQFQSQTYDGVISTSNGGTLSTITSGVQIFALNFTPVSATSTILVQTCSIAISEESNAGDRGWLALFYGSTFVAGNSGSPLYNHYSGNYNVNHPSINHTIPSWGTTTQLIQIRGGMEGSCYINGNSGYNYTGSSARISMTVMEIAG